MEHLTLLDGEAGHPTIELDFLGKDSMRYHEKIDVCRARAAGMNGCARLVMSADSWSGTARRGSKCLQT